jgi:thioredoxin-related protein
MTSHLRASLLPALLLLGLAVTPRAAAAAEEIQWLSWDAGLEQAETSGRPILVDVYTDWCGWCKRMDREVYARADVRDALSRRFVPIKLNAESKATATYQSQKLTERGIAAKFKVSGYPTTVFLASNGKHLVNAPGYLAPDRFLQVLSYVGDGHFERGTSFEDFTRKSK